MARNVTVLIVVVSILGILYSIYNYLEGFRVIHQEPTLAQLQGTWVIVTSGHIPREKRKNIKIIIEDGHAELLNFPDLTEYRSPEKFANPMIYYRSMTVPVRVKAMPSGWGIEILENDLRFVEYRGRFSIFQTPNVSNPITTVYQRAE